MYTFPVSYEKLKVLTRTKTKKFILDGETRGKIHSATEITVKKKAGSKENIILMKTHKNILSFYYEY